MTSKKNLYIFSFVTLICSVVALAASVTINGSMPQSTVLIVSVYQAVPLIIAATLRAVNEESWLTGVKPGFLGNWKWLIISVVIIPVVVLLVGGIGALTGTSNYRFLGTDIFTIMAQNSILSVFALKAISEFGWRGYMTEKMINLNVKDIYMYGITGAVWAFCSLPYYIYTVFVYRGAIPDVAALVMRFLLMFVLNIVMVELYRLTRSIWACVILFTLEEKMSIGLIIAGGLFTFSGSNLVWNPINGIAAMVLFLAIGLVLRWFRIQSDKKRRLERRKTRTVRSLISLVDKESGNEDAGILLEGFERYVKEKFPKRDSAEVIQSLKENEVLSRDTENEEDQKAKEKALAFVDAVITVYLAETGQEAEKPEENTGENAEEVLSAETAEEVSDTSGEAAEADTEEEADAAESETETEVAATVTAEAEK